MIALYSRTLFHINNTFTVYNVCYVKRDSIINHHQVQFWLPDKDSFLLVSAMAKDDEDVVSSGC